MAMGVEFDDSLVVDPESKKTLKEPPKYQVLIHNDDYTTMEFVVMILKGVFCMSDSKAVEVMLHVHENGVGVAGLYSFEVAETKVEKVRRLAREHDYPLLCTMEPN